MQVTDALVILAADPGWWIHMYGEEGAETVRLARAVVAHDEPMAMLESGMLVSGDDIAFLVSVGYAS